MGLDKARSDVKKTSLDPDLGRASVGIDFTSIFITFLCERRSTLSTRCKEQSNNNKYLL